jgi:hypothetical protein
LNRLQRLTLNGFKSIKAIDIELHPLNILIGANGAGKSNLISFFKMLNEMMAGRFQQFIAVSGRSQSLLYFGPKTTPQIEAKLEFEVENGVDSYHLRLFHAAGDTLIFAEETLSFVQTGRTSPRTDELGAGHQETRIKEAAKEGKQTARMLEYLLNRCRVYHFHDTSSTAGVRQSCYVGDSRWLMPDAGNLAALLLRFREENGGAAYQRIIGTIRLIAPFFDDFVLEPDVSNRVILNWREKESDRVFGPHIQLHEYEAYLFSDPRCFEYLDAGRTKEIEALQAIASQYQTPELINDGQQTAPSKRIMAQFPDYGKAKSIFGPLLAEQIGLQVIRSKCSHFHKWLLRLESLNGEGISS